MHARSNEPAKNFIVLPQYSRRKCIKNFTVIFARHGECSLLSEAFTIKLHLCPTRISENCRGASRLHGDLFVHFTAFAGRQSHECAYQRKYRCARNENSIASSSGYRVTVAGTRGYLRRASRAFCCCRRCFHPPSPIKFPISLFFCLLCLYAVTESREPVHHQKPPHAFVLCFR